MAGGNQGKGGGAPIIIKKVKKGHHDGHHGGAWKVAYADFVTAMMAFFLLLWLLNVTTDVQKRGIADYFDPGLAMQNPSSGSGGFLGGRVIGQTGSMPKTAAAPALSTPILAQRQPTEGEEGDESGGAGQSTTDIEGPGKKDRKGVGEAEAQKIAAEREERQFATAEFALRQAIQDVPELKNLAENLLIDRTPEGLRIQLVDQEKISMFSSGSAEMQESARRFMGVVAKVLRSMPNRVAVAGHTDATPFTRAGNYGNWELSADRANASRRELLTAGVPADRIDRVVGKADRDPLFAAEPLSPRNRRISIVLLRDAKPVEPSRAALGGAPTSLAQR